MTKSKCDKNLLVQGHGIHLEGEPITKKKKAETSFTVHSMLAVY